MTPDGRRQERAGIEREAAAWAARVDGGALPPGDQLTLDAWLAADQRHLGSFAKARAVLAHTDRASALGAAYDPADFVARPTRTATRRVWLAGGFAVAASVGAVAVLQNLRPRMVTHSTARGEVRLLSLTDGSTMTLNTASKAEVRFSPHRRHITLVSGEALFDVAHNPDRPFVVDAGDTRALATGTSFSVRRMDDRRAKILVREGAVQVGAPQPHGGVTLHANHGALLDGGMLVKTIDLAPAEMDGALAWREGMISFEGVTLEQAAAEFQRYSDVRISIPDPRVRARRVTGLYSASDPQGFARAVAESLNLRMERDRNGVLLVS